MYCIESRCSVKNKIEIGTALPALLKLGLNVTKNLDFPCQNIGLNCDENWDFLCQNIGIDCDEKLGFSLQPKHRTNLR